MSEMKIQYKEQDFQREAVEAVVDCFAGQPQEAERYMLERSSEILRRRKEQEKGEYSLEMAEGELEENLGYRSKRVKITEVQVLANIRTVQDRNRIRLSDKIERVGNENESYNITIEMETGTGKTYTYIRTMYELRKKYGWSKYIIIVPSVAIREGVHKAFEDTQEHFMEKYNRKIRAYIYNSKSPQDIDSFAYESEISVMIINTQAYARRTKENLLIHQEQDRHGQRAPIEILAGARPILIVDEPQSVEGKVALEMMKHFNPLFTLRYSATHKREYNMVYRLDAYDAYSRKLVKKIRVKGVKILGDSGVSGYFYLEQIVLSETGQPLALVEFEQRTESGKVRRVRRKLKEGTNIYKLSGEMPQYRNMLIERVDGRYNKIEILGDELYTGEALGDIDEKDMRRIQIRETIKSHLDKEKKLFERGIKVLSLFFIDSVEKYRKYDEAGNEIAGEYVKIFEDEYKKLANNYFDLFGEDYNKYLEATEKGKIYNGYMPKDYLEYLERDEAGKVHNGYFSIDRQNRLIDPTVKRRKGKEGESNDESAYELIMRDKQRLMSFEEPTRFIFSHSALKEGWDNPNVFQICALKHSEADIRRKQEVGRGMRLCVDKEGIRQDFELLGEEVQEINKLTVVASESYEDFARGLQNELVKSLRSRPSKADAGYFEGKQLKSETGLEIRLDRKAAQMLYRYLLKYDIIDFEDMITETGRQLIEKGEITLPRELQTFKKPIIELLKKVYNGDELRPENARAEQTLKLNKNFYKKEFQALWERINFKSTYEIQLDSDKLVRDSVNKINSKLNISGRHYEVKTGELGDRSLDDWKRKEGFTRVPGGTKKLESNIFSNTLYDIVGEIEHRTNLTRRTIVEILKKIRPQKFYKIQVNPEEFITKCSNLITEVKATLIVNNIIYTKSDERHVTATVFSNDLKAMQKSEKLKKHIYDYLVTESGVEERLAEELENHSEVTVYAKLPRSFQISTPIANYSPDWAIVFDNEKVRYIYFVAETKGSMKSTEERQTETVKIHCAEKHFEAISGSKVKFGKVVTYGDMLEIVRVK
jgi:type III restriction enzyme